MIDAEEDLEIIVAAFKLPQAIHRALLSPEFFELKITETAPLSFFFVCFVVLRALRDLIEA